MSDLKTEMKKVMNQWENVAMLTSNAPLIDTKSFGERVFEYIKARPYSSAIEVEEQLDPCDTQSVSSTLKTLFDRGIVGREEKPNPNYCGTGRKTMWVYYPTHDKYETLNQGYWKPKGAKSTPKKLGRPKKETVMPRLPQAPQLTQLQQELLNPRARFNPEAYVKGLSLTEVKELYVFLKNYFQ